MSFTVINVEQRSPEWRKARAGRLTGSCAHILLMKGRGKNAESKTRAEYRTQLVSERINEEAGESFLMTEEMQHAIVLEPLAFGAYEAATGYMVRKTGFLQHNEWMAGCSLDGDVDNFSGIIELKCPLISTHVTYRKAPQTLVDKYLPQIRHNLWVSGAAWCDVVSYCDRVPRKIALCRVRVERYDAGLKEYEEAALQFLAEVAQEYEEIMDGVFV